MASNTTGLPPELAECPYCGKSKHFSMPYCRPCRLRWERAGQPDSGPPPPRDPEGGIEDLQEIWYRGMTAGEAAAKLGKSARTIERYKKKLRQRGVTLR
jgi:hypothetical protein